MIVQCEVCGKKERLLKARNDSGDIAFICENCYNTACEGYELIE